MGKDKKKGAAFTPEQVARVAALRDSGRTPRDVLAAFLAGEVTLATLQLPPLDLARYMALEAIRSPLVDKELSMESVKAIDLCRALVLMVSTLDDARRLSADMDELDQAAWELAAKIPIAQIGDFVLAVRRIIASGFDSVISGKKKKASSPSQAADSAGR